MELLTRARKGGFFVLTEGEGGGGGGASGSGRKDPPPHHWENAGQATVAMMEGRCGAEGKGHLESVIH